MRRCISRVLSGCACRQYSKIVRVASPNAPEAIGPYSQACMFDNFIFLSGQLGIDPKTGEFAGDSVAAQSRQAILNLEAVLEEAGTTLGHVLKTTVLLAEMDDFQELNEVYAKAFQGLGYPARACYAVKDLPKGALVEIEAVAVKESDL